MVLLTLIDLVQMVNTWQLDQMTAVLTSMSFAKDDLFHVLVTVRESLLSSLRWTSLLMAGSFR